MRRSRRARRKRRRRRRGDPLPNDTRSWKEEGEAKKLPAYSVTSEEEEKKEEEGDQLSVCQATIWIAASVPGNFSFATTLHSAKARPDSPSISPATC